MIATAAICVLPSLCQDKVPLYRVTVIQRNVDSVNYQYHSGPTKIDFRGTVLLPNAKGDAAVDSQKGHTEIDAKFEGLAAPQRFGREYLSYVLWAVTPDGASHNLGEILPNSSDRAHLTVTTDLQAFGLIVTAEPYASVRHPGDVVVLENQIRPDTIGEVKPIQAKVELMPRGSYTWNVPDSETAGVSNAPKVSMSRYQAILQVYEAQNALGIARTAGAEKYAPDVLAKAQEEFNQAQQLQSGKGNDDRIVQYARSATEIAEDARIIAERHQEEEAVVAARRDTVAAEQAKLQAQVTAEKERQRADTAQAQAQAEHEARERAELEAKMARDRADQTPTAVIVQTVPAQSLQTAAPAPDNSAKELRVQLLQRMDTAMLTRDTPRGLDATLNDNDFAGGQLKPAAASGVAQLAATLMNHPGLRITVEGDTDSADGSGLASQRAATVAAALVRAGVPAQQVSSVSAGNSRLVVSNATERGRIENRRVEILVSGDAIGTVPTWDQTYPLSFDREKK
jgi:outer membrane protein OmpA-like peptidoglycan-associated protein